MILACGLALSACNGRKEDNPVIPPVTSPLSNNYIGFAVINVSYTGVRAEPEEGSPSIGYLRRGSLVRVIERRTIIRSGSSVSWVFAEGNYRGWLKEEEMDIYSSESRARTASENMSR